MNSPVFNKRKAVFSTPERNVEKEETKVSFPNDSDITALELLLFGESPPR